MKVALQPSAAFLFLFHCFALKLLNVTEKQQQCGHVEITKHKSLTPV